MKLCVVILLGAADQPLEALDAGTPLSAARLPALDRLSAEGRVGGVTLIPPKLEASSEAALATLFGLDPAASPPAAGALLASALQVEVGPDELAFRCDLVNLYGGTVVDPTAGRLGGTEAGILVEALERELGSETVRFCGGLRWRTLLVLGGEGLEKIRTTSPALFFGEPRKEYLPRRGKADVLRNLMERAEAVLGEHEVNAVRVDLNENPANGIWIWGGGRPEAVPEMANGRGVAIGSHPSFLGLARAAGVAVQPASLELDPTGDPGPVGEACLRELEDSDLVLALLEGPTVLSRLGEVETKVRYLEAVDGSVVAPLAERLVASGEGRLLVVASHAASTELRRDCHGISPFVVAGPGTASYGAAGFTESGAEAADLKVEHGWELLEYAGRP